MLCVKIILFIGREGEIVSYQINSILKENAYKLCLLYMGTPFVFFEVNCTFPQYIFSQIFIFSGLYSAHTNCFEGCLARREFTCKKYSQPIENLSLRKQRILNYSKIKLNWNFLCLKQNEMGRKI